MELKPFKKDYLKHINEWLLQRNKEGVEINSLPAVGLIAMIDKEYVAAGFLRQCEGVGIIDSMVSNPQSSSQDRDEALNLLFKKLIEMARLYNIKHLIGFSIDDHMIARSEKYGFKKSDNTLMVRYHI